MSGSAWDVAEALRGGTLEGSAVRCAVQGGHVPPVVSSPTHASPPLTLPSASGPVPRPHWVRGVRRAGSRETPPQPGAGPAAAHLPKPRAQGLRRSGAAHRHGPPDPPPVSPPGRGRSGYHCRWVGGKFAEQGDCPGDSSWAPEGQRSAPARQGPGVARPLVGSIWLWPTTVPVPRRWPVL